MEVKLNQKPKNPVIVQGFPGFGLIGTIATEFLIEQLKAVPIGKVKVTEMPAMVALHEGKVVQPFGIYYDKKTNIIVIHVVTPIKGIEWQLSDAIIKLARDLGAKDLISLEGVSSPYETGEAQCFYYAKNEQQVKKLAKASVKPLREGIILGVSGALMLESDIPLCCVFVEAHSAMPDSRAAAKIIEVLDSYLDLKIDVEPLLEQAEKFEQKLKGIMEQSKRATEEQEKKNLNYVG